MSVRKKIVHGTVYWLADYTDAAGKRHQVRFEKKDEAEAHEEEQKVAIRAGTHVSLDSNLTVADAAAKWIKKVEADAVERPHPRKIGAAVDRARTRRWPRQPAEATNRPARQACGVLRR